MDVSSRRGAKPDLGWRWSTAGSLSRMPIVDDRIGAAETLVQFLGARAAERARRAAGEESDLVAPATSAVTSGSSEARSIALP